MSEAQTTTTGSIGRELLNAGRNLLLAGIGAVVEADNASLKLFDRLVERGRPLDERQRKAAEAFAKDEVPDPGNVKIQTRLNGQVMQDANTDDLVFSVVKLIEYYSQFYRFQPGDCITTGSPSGSTGSTNT